jgi:hypothetical protein
MKKPDRSLRKSYAMERMAAAIDRAIGDRTGKEKERAARWAAAWGLLCGIRTEGVRLRRDDIRNECDEWACSPSGQIETLAQSGRAPLLQEFSPPPVSHSELHPDVHA